MFLFINNIMCYTIERQPLQDESKEEDIDEEETRHHSGGNKRSYLEQLKDLRDYKRRRQSYRAKNVHITRRTPVQVGNSFPTAC